MRERRIARGIHHSHTHTHHAASGAQRTCCIRASTRRDARRAANPLHELSGRELLYEAEPAQLEDGDGCGCCLPLTWPWGGLASANSATRTGLSRSRLGWQRGERRRQRTHTRGVTERSGQGERGAAAHHSTCQPTHTRAPRTGCSGTSLVHRQTSNPPSSAKQKAPTESHCGELHAARARAGAPAFQ